MDSAVMEHGKVLVDRVAAVRESVKRAVANGTALERLQELARQWYDIVAGQKRAKRVLMGMTDTEMVFMAALASNALMLELHVQLSAKSRAMPDVQEIPE